MVDSGLLSFVVICVVEHRSQECCTIRTRELVSGCFGESEDRKILTGSSGLAATRETAVAKPRVLRKPET